MMIENAEFFDAKFLLLLMQNVREQRGNQQADLMKRTHQRYASSVAVPPCFALLEMCEIVINLCIKAIHSILI